MPETPETIAELKIKDADKFTKAGRKDVADWLRRQADDLERDAPDYDEKFRARYMVGK